MGEKVNEPMEIGAKDGHMTCTIYFGFTLGIASMVDPFSSTLHNKLESISVTQSFTQAPTVPIFPRQISVLCEGCWEKQHSVSLYFPGHEKLAHFVMKLICTHNFGHNIESNFGYDFEQ